MAVENVKSFFQALKNDPKLREALQDIKAGNFRDAANEIAQAASAAGHSFTGADYEAAVRDHVDQQWRRYREMTPEQEKELGVSPATLPLGADTVSDMVISECIACNNTRWYTPCGC
ncbi:MAG TPA: Nif11-like leader peptide family natural product precursor [Thermoanaerobaculia bacterium]